MLSCNCDYDGSDYGIYYYVPEDFISMPKLSRRKRCWSCHQFIAPGSAVLEFKNFRGPRCWYEENRFGDEISLASKYLCENCGEIYLNLQAAGFCVIIDRNIREDLAEYWQIKGFDPKKYLEKSQCQTL